MQNVEKLNFIGTVELDNTIKTFGFLPEDRRRHVYMIGKSGMGKSTLLENMILQDIYAGDGVCFLDPLGDSAESILDQIPGFRQKDVIYFNPADTEFPIGLNMLESNNGEPPFLVASSLMAVLKRIWAGVWSARMEYILNNTILALLDTPGNTLLGVVRMLTNDDFRSAIVENIQNIMVKNFWTQEYTKFDQKYKTEAISPILNKVGQFFSSTMIRNILGQRTSQIDFRDIMDSKKIMIANLAKGKLGEDNSSLLGSMLVTKFQLAAMSRNDISESERQDFFLYVDEFQNFTNDSFATILSEARKFRLCLTIAHQYIAQLTAGDPDEVIKNAVFGNVGTIISFRIGSADSEDMEKELFPLSKNGELRKLFLNLDRSQIIVRTSVLNKVLDPFTANTLPPIYSSIKGNKLAMTTTSRQLYATPRIQVEQSIASYFDSTAILDEQGNVIARPRKKKKKKKKNKLDDSDTPIQSGETMVFVGGGDYSEE